MWAYAPKPDDIQFSEQMTQAMEHYGENAPYHYLVSVHFFDSYGNFVHFSTEEPEAEADRLAELVGFVGTAVESIKGDPPCLVLNATLEEIQAFPGKAGYGCYLRLRDEGLLVVSQ